MTGLDQFWKFSPKIEFRTAWSFWKLSSQKVNFWRTYEEFDWIRFRKFAVISLAFQRVGMTLDLKLEKIGSCYREDRVDTVSFGSFLYGRITFSRKDREARRIVRIEIGNIGSYMRADSHGSPSGWIKSGDCSTIGCLILQSIHTSLYIIENVCVYSFAVERIRGCSCTSLGEYTAEKCENYWYCLGHISLSRDIDVAPPSYAGSLSLQI